MRNGFWLTVISLALAAIVAGYLDGAAASRPPPVVTLHPDAQITGQPIRIDTASIGAHQSTDTAVLDLFSDDDVVVERPERSSLDWQPERLSFVVGLCGASLVVESGFFQLGVPIAIDLDPGAADAKRVAQAARASGEPLFVHVTGAPSRTTLEALRRRLGDFDGIAGQDATGVAHALAGAGLAYFDERGDAPNADFSTAGVPLVQRDITIDDRAAGGYIAFMLERAAERSRHSGRVVVLMRPLPETLQAVKNFLQNHNAEITAVE